MTDAAVEYFGSSQPKKKESSKKMPFDRLTTIFGSTAGVQNNYDCFKNALHNSVLAIIDGTNEPSIYDVPTSVGRHAYLSLSGQTRSEGFTWFNSFYPELTLNQIQSLKGTDVTIRLLTQALDPEIDVEGYHRVIDKLEEQFPHVKSTIKLYIDNKIHERN